MTIEQKDRPLGDLLTASQTALQKLEAGRAKLLNNDGSRIYSDAEHEIRATQLLEEFNTEVEALVTQAEQRASSVEAAAANLQADPTAHLKPEELQAANLRAEFVREEAASLPLPQLLTRCQEAIAAGDKAGLFLWSRYAGQRLDTVMEQLRAADVPPTLDDRSSTPLVAASKVPVLNFRDTMAFNKLKQLVPQMRDTLVPEAVRNRAQTLEDIQEAARTFKLRAKMLRDQASGAVAAFDRSYTRQYREGF